MSEQQAAEAIIPRINGKRFVCKECKEGWGLFSKVQDPKYGELLVCKSCGAEYQATYGT